MSSIRCKSCIKLWRNKKGLQKITKFKPFILNYNWERINLPSGKDDWEKVEKNNVTIALNLYVLKKKKYILFMFQYITQTLKNELFF